jgi:hypothetical protein
MTTYTFSWYRKDRVPSIRHPKWWQFWKRAELVYTNQWARHCLLEIPKDEADVLMDLSADKVEERLIHRLLGPDVKMVQLESTGHPTPYVATTTDARFAGKRYVRNLMTRSDDLMSKDGWTK